MNFQEVEKLARIWLSVDPDPETWSELEELLKSFEEDGSESGAQKLTSLFDGALSFGTAGLRAELGPGPKRMNRVLVQLATRALLKTIEEAGDSNIYANSIPKVVIGYDGRKNSDVFARDIAGVVYSMGGTPLLIDAKLPTPVLARSVLSKKAAAGIMVTASHNPRADNGYKVYWADGSQITSHSDRLVERKILDFLPGDVKDYGATTEGGKVKVIKKDITKAAVKDYVRCLKKNLSEDFGGGDLADLKIAYTPLHGVGKGTLEETFKSFNFPKPLTVKEQAEPDGTFPTVPFPNPEESGALDMVLDLAKEAGADMVLANDPDADRLSVSLPVSPSDSRTSLAPTSTASTSLTPPPPNSLTSQSPNPSSNQDVTIFSDSNTSTPQSFGLPSHGVEMSNTKGEWRTLTGNELGVLLGDYCIEKFLTDSKQKNGGANKRGANKKGEVVKGLVATTCVSSQLLGKVAKANNIEYVETLTGFKWISRADQLVQSNQSNQSANPAQPINQSSQSPHQQTQSTTSPTNPQTDQTTQSADQSNPPSHQSTQSTNPDNPPSHPPASNKISYDFIFGYEEALGYAVLPKHIRDKDGISAAIAFVNLFLKLRQKGLTPFDRLSQIYEEHGIHMTGAASIRYESGGDGGGKNRDPAEQGAAAMAKLRAELPTQIGGVKVLEVVDYSEPQKNLRPANMVSFYLEGESRIVVRPSGTEPKLKVYVELVEKNLSASDDDLQRQIGVLIDATVKLFTQ